MPIDNNVCERALKKAILHRKNSLFYKAENEARVGDLFMSLIHTCELCGANSFDYLTQLQQHAGDFARNPSEWMPWNYQTALGFWPGVWAEENSVPRRPLRSCLHPRPANFGLCLALVMTATTAPC